jgi:hypothetical protein
MTAKLGDTVKENICSAFVLKFPKILENGVTRNTIGSSCAAEPAAVVESEAGNRRL